MSKFTGSEKIQSFRARATKLQEEGRRFSDIEDAGGNQYVDLVQEGGGVLGIALVGYTYILENAGIRFFSLAGTSAGAINTMMIAGLGAIEEAKSEKILKILNEKNLFDLVDGDKRIRKIIQKAIKNEGGIGWSLALNAIRIYKTLKNKLGLNPGNDFEQWISEELQKVNIHTLEDLEKLRKTLPDGLKNIVSDSWKPAFPKLAIITSDITTHTKVEFPKMTGLYWEDPQKVNPAKLVRASMSIPLFFEPMEAGNIPNAGNKKDPAWDKYARYTGEIPGKVKFVDGGMLSNFPINVFHRTDGTVPSRPSLGVRLSGYRESYSNTDSFLGMNAAMISTMRQIYDYDFLLRNPDYQKLICRIDADQYFNWLDFNMTEEDQIALFELGAKNAIEFLETFEWTEYKEIRKSINRK